MKKLLSVLLLFCLLAPCAVAAQEYYYPFGLTKDSTYEEAVSKVLMMYETPEERIVRRDDVTAIFPVGYKLFEMPLNGILIYKSETRKGYSKMLIKMKNTVSFDDALHFLDVVTFVMEHSKTGLQMVEPYETVYDLNGDVTIKTFLDDVYTFADDFENKNKSFEYALSWGDTYINLTKNGSEYELSIMFFAE